MRFKEILGWYGAVAIVIAYGLSSFKIVEAKSIFYQLLNLTGAIGIIVISIEKKTYQAATLNIVWAIIAIISIATITLI